MRRPMRIGGKRVAGAIAVAAAIAIALASALVATAQDPDPVAAPDREIPQLSADEAARAISLVRRSPFLEQLRLPREPAVAEVGVWHASSSLEKLGAVVMLQLPAPVRIRATLPAIAYERAEKSTQPYKERALDVDVANVTSLLAAVDLGRDRLVQLVPGPGAVTTHEGARR